MPGSQTKIDFRNTVRENEEFNFLKYLNIYNGGGVALDDINNDGLLDIYVCKSGSVNNPALRKNKLFVNQGNNTFTDQADQYKLADPSFSMQTYFFDYDNDFLQADHLWINNQKGGFTDQASTQFDHISFYSIGSDIADVNNDGLADLVVPDMVPEDHARSKQTMPSMSTEQFHALVSVGYHHQYMANVLQLNRGKGVFSDIGHFAGIAKTD